MIIYRTKRWRPSDVCSYSLSHEVSPRVGRETADTLCDLSTQGMVRGRPWYALQAQAFSMIQSQQDGSPA